MISWRCVSVAALTVVWTAVFGGPVPAQTLQLAEQEPRFLSAPADHAAPTDVSDAPVFARRVTLEFNRVPLGTALRLVGQRAEIRLSFSATEVPVDRPVSVSATDITVGGALHELLWGTGLDVRLSPNGLVSIIPRTPAASKLTSAAKHQLAGTIAGRVTDALTHAPLDQVSVRIEGLGLGGVTTNDGRYTVRDIPPSTYRVTARRVGYAALSKSVIVTVDSSARMDFALAAAPTRLNEMVTTAVGDQRRYEVGTAISTINADSIAPTAPITSLTDLISARAPGVEVLETGGLTGAGEAIRIRGLTSLVLQGDPILIVDGVRQDNSAGGDVGAYFSTGYGGSNGSHPSPTRLNDLDFNDIASIDILKGPSASTEYGTDAANGVIVITTKHGTAGLPQWTVSAEQTKSGLPVRFANGYYSWGHTTDGARTAVECPLVNGFASRGYASTIGNCVVDSVTQWNPLNHAATTIFGTGNRGKYDLSVSGGSTALRYYVSGGLSNETGAIQMPPVFRTLADTAHVGLPKSAFTSNREQQRSARATTAIELGPTTDFTATGSYLSTYQQTPDAGSLYYGAFVSHALRDPAHDYGYGLIGSPAPLSPLAFLSMLGSQNTNRVTGGLTTNWRPAAWFVGHVTAGIDHGSQRNQILNYPLANAGR